MRNRTSVAKTITILFFLLILPGMNFYPTVPGSGSSPKSGRQQLAHPSISPEGMVLSPSGGSPSVSVKPGFWFADWGGSSDEWINGVTIAPDGSVYETGTSGSFSSNGDAILLKYSADGTFQWAKRWNDGAPGGDVGVGVAASSDGSSVYVAGVAWQSLSGPTTGFLLQVKPDGSFGWIKEWSDSSSVSPNGVAVSADGSVYLTGGNFSTVAQIFYMDGFLMKFSSSGSITWTHFWKGPNAQVWGTAVTTDSNNNAFVTGSVMLGALTATSLLKFSAAGTLNYEMYFTPAKAYSIGEGLSFTPDQSALYVSGVDFSVQLTTITKCQPPSPSCAEELPLTFSDSFSGSAYLAKVNPSDGSLAWREETNIASGSFDAALAVTGSNDEGAYVAGITSGPFGSFAQDSLFAMKFASNGQISAQSWWHDCVQGPFNTCGNSDGWGAALSPDGGVFVGGSIDSADSYALSTMNVTPASLSTSTLPSLPVPPQTSVTSKTYQPSTICSAPCSSYLLTANGNNYYSGGLDTTLMHLDPPSTVTFAATPPGAGTVSPSGTGGYFDGSQLTVSASPAGGIFFDRWDPGSALYIPSSQINTASTTATIVAPGSATAYFYSNLNVGVSPGHCYTLNPSPGGNQQEFCGSNTYSYHAGTVVSVIASDLQKGAAGMQIGLAEPSALVSTDATSSSPPTTIVVSMSLSNVDPSIGYLSSVPTMQFTETGLPAGAIWTVNLTAYRLTGELWHYTQNAPASNSISFTGFQSNGWPVSFPTVAYRGCNYGPISPPTSYPTGQASVNIAYAATACTTTATQTATLTTTKTTTITTTALKTATTTAPVTTTTTTNTIHTTVTATKTTTSTATNSLISWATYTVTFTNTATVTSTKTNTVTTTSTSTPTKTATSTVTSTITTVSTYTKPVVVTKTNTVTSVKTVTSTTSVRYCAPQANLLQAPLGATTSTATVTTTVTTTAPATTTSTITSTITKTTYSTTSTATGTTTTTGTTTSTITSATTRTTVSTGHYESDVTTTTTTSTTVTQVVTTTAVVTGSTVTVTVTTTSTSSVVIVDTITLTSTSTVNTTVTSTTTTVTTITGC